MLCLELSSPNTSIRERFDPFHWQVQPATGVAGDTLVMHTGSGWPVALQDLAERRDGLVLTLREGGILAPRRPVAFVRHGPAQLYRLLTCTGRCIETTAHRPFLTPGGWKALSALDSSDRVAVIAEYPRLFGRTDTDAMRLKLLAYLTKNGAHGDGAVPPISDMEVRRDFEAAVEAIGDVHIQVGDADGDHHVRVCGRDGAPSRALAYLSLVGVHGIRGSDKVIPDFVFGLREDKLRLFLRCLLTCDGMVAGLEPPGDPGHILYRTTSVRLARQLQHLFARFGIVAALVGPSSDTGGGAELAIAVKADVIRCIEQIGFLGDKAMQAARLHAQLYSFHGGGEQPGRLGPILFDAVLSIEASRVAKSYDLQVDRSSNFIANEFVTHNEPHRPY